MIDPFAHLKDRETYRDYYERGAVGPWAVLERREPRVQWALAHVQAHDDVIDIGCRKGEVTWYLRQATDGRVVGVDLSERALAEAREFCVTERPIAWVHGDAEQLPFDENSFDVAVLCELLEHVIDLHAVVREAERVVKPGGRVVVSVPCQAIKLSQNELAGRDPAVWGDLKDCLAHVREVVPSALFAGRKGLRLEYGAVPGIRFRLASYEVVKNVSTG